MQTLLKAVTPCSEEWKKSRIVHSCYGRENLWPIQNPQRVLKRQNVFLCMLKWQILLKCTEHLSCYPFLLCSHILIMLNFSTPIWKFISLFTILSFPYLSNFSKISFCLTFFFHNLLIICNNTSSSGFFSEVLCRFQKCQGTSSHDHMFFFILEWAYPYEFWRGLSNRGWIICGVTVPSVEGRISHEG